MQALTSKSSQYKQHGLVVHISLLPFYERVANVTCTTASTHNSACYTILTVKCENYIGSGADEINEQFVGWVTDVQVWEAEPKDGTEPGLGPRLSRKRLCGQPK